MRETVKAQQLTVVTYLCVLAGHSWKIFENAELYIRMCAL